MLILCIKMQEHTTPGMLYHQSEPGQPSAANNVLPLRGAVYRTAVAYHRHAFPHRVEARPWLPMFVCNGSQDSIHPFSMKVTPHHPHLTITLRQPRNLIQPLLFRSHLARRQSLSALSCKYSKNRQGLTSASHFFLYSAILASNVDRSS